ncbi:hypothetical protein KJ813_04295 [bacterium]|nr:hypothetical protein [bacterium]
MRLQKFTKKFLVSGWKGKDKIATGSTQVILSAPLAMTGRLKTNNIYLQMGKMCNVCGKIPS